MSGPDAKVRYALLAALDLAVHARHPRRAKLKEIAARTGVPTPFLAHILLLLKRRFLVSTSRGPRGGYSLLRPPQTVSVADIVQAVSASGRRSQREDPLGKALWRLWSEAERERLRALAQVSLADLARQAGYALD